MGLVVFSVLLIVNFIVITKGAGRMAEVGARFALDGMPGKQLAIDSDMAAGAITHEEAKERRRIEQEETTFFGSLDGASKFVKADVIAVNPTHFAVALKWSKTKGSAPVCVTKGEDEIAARIREIASQSGVPIHSDPPTARAIHATTNVGDEISPDQYRAIAAALRFAEIMRKKARERGR